MAGAAEDGVLVPFGVRPGLQTMPGESVVAVFARVEDTATAHLDSDNVESRVEVEAAGLRVELETVYERSHNSNEPKCSVKESVRVKGTPEYFEVQS